MITITGIQAPPIALIWDTSLKEIASLTIVFDGKDQVNLQKDDPVAVTWGPPGNMERLAGYRVWRVRRGERTEIIALEFGQEWQAKTQEVYPGPRPAAIAKLLGKRGEKAGQIDITGGDRAYAQNESDIAFLYRLAGNIPVWRDGQGAVNVAIPPQVKVGQVIEYKPAAVAGKKYVAAGFTPQGQAFEVAVGDGIETRVAEVFHSPAEARDYLQRLAAADPKGRLICVGQTGLRAGCDVLLPDGSKRRVTKCTHEVRHEAWMVTAYLN